MKRRPPAAMVRPYTALHKNLAELESILCQLREAEPDASAFKRQTICGEMVAAKIDFLKALLAAEKEVHAAGAPPPHILHLTERLRTVEDALRDCDGDESSVLPAEDDGLRHASMCSCTDECFEEEVPESEPDEEEEEEEEEEDDGRVPEPEDFGTTMDENLEEGEGSGTAITEEGEGETQLGRGCQCQCRCIGTASPQCRLIGVAMAMVGLVVVGIGVATNVYSVEEFALVPT